MADVTLEIIWTDRILLYAAALNALIILIILSCQLHHKSKRKSSNLSAAKVANNVRQTRILNTFALSVPVITAIYTSQRAISRLGIGNCKLHTIFAGFLWTTVKLMMYLFFIARLDVAFRCSAFKFSRTVFVFLYILVVFAWATSNLEYIIWGDAIKVSIADLNLTWCASISPPFTLIYFAVCDVTICVFLTFLFSKRLLDAFYVKKQATNKQELNKVIKTVARYVTLSIVGVSTTVLSLLILAFTGNFAAMALDMIVNNHCIFLMYSVNLKYFHCVCGPLHSCIGKCFKRWMGDDDDDGIDVIKVYEITHSHPHSTTNLCAERSAVSPVSKEESAEKEPAATPSTLELHVIHNQQT
eukprot:CAMPEP_0197030494 /NCGR_PEP_ID=MMETSP1384-20130603/9722_1 /TAXON_ID=29189 /ORGANISM="Ammonia sp." /LENGTH=356 /DNA_ID=CAMNT_0042459861 /DNA_START=35 /DNA_END=1105 /DNA_ORIENTATION=-